MATDAAIGYGASFKRGDGASPEVFTALGEVTAINGFELSKDTVDATHMGSPDRYREFISGLRDGGEVSVELNFVPDGTAITNAFTDFDADVARNYQIVWADTSDFEFSGICTGISTAVPVDDKMSATFTYKVTGKPTFTGA